MRVPKGFPVKVLKPSDEAKDRATCGTCGRSWDDGVVTEYTPAPSARCPFEAFHDEPKAARKSHPRNIPPGERCKLAREVFDAAFEARESFREEHIGADLAYLLGAIVDYRNFRDAIVDWSPEAYGEEPPALLAILKEKFPSRHHKVWEFILLPDEQED